MEAVAFPAHATTADAAGRDGRPALGVGIERLTKRYGAFLALDDVALQLRPGEFLTLLGPSGSGKTTLLNCIAGFVRPDFGRLTFGGRDVTATPPNKRDLGMVFQSYALFPHMTVGQNIAFPLELRRIGRAEITRRVQDVLGLVRLDGLQDRPVADLSGGQRQRVALARAVVFAPSIVLMDEPLSALDKNLREHMQVELRRLHREIGATTLYVTHDQREALTMSDRIAVMDRGRIVQCGTPRVIYDHPANAFVAGFIGETSLLPGVVAGGVARLACGTALTGAGAMPPDGPVAAVARAERVLLAGEGDASTAWIDVRVEDAVFQGESTLLLVRTSDGVQVSLRRTARGRGADLSNQGDAIRIGLDAATTPVVPLT